MSAKSITILFPCHGLEPRGGLKVAFEYANRLSRDGFEMHIAYPALPFEGPHPFRIKIRMWIKYFYFRFIRGYSCRRWFTLDKGIREHYLYSLDYHYVPKTEIYIATAVGTAIFLEKYPIPLRNKMYLIQDFENWQVSSDRVKQTYNYGFKNVVVSKWLAEIVRTAGANCTIIKNGFDFDYFKLSVPIVDRDRFSIAMMYSTQQRKGVEYGLKALYYVKSKYPQLKITLFGVHPRPHTLPKQYEYYQCPNREIHNNIYNNAAVFLAPSIDEGWGLPIGEAMICGCAVVCTDNKGFQEMAEDGVSALMSKVKDVDALAANMIRLIEDNNLRIEIAEQGNRSIQRFRWEDSYEKLKKLL